MEFRFPSEERTKLLMLF